MCVFLFLLLNSHFSEVRLHDSCWGEVLREKMNKKGREREDEGEREVEKIGL